MYNIVAGSRELAAGKDTVELRLEAPGANGVKVTKVFSFKRGSYLIDVAYEIDNGSQREVGAHAYYQLQRDTQAPAGETTMVSTFTGPAVPTRNRASSRKSTSRMSRKATPSSRRIRIQAGWP